MLECPRETCWPDAGCDLGYLDLSKCPALKAKSAGKQDDRTQSKVVSMPWSGNVLGLMDLGFVAGRNKPIVVAVVGPHNAGKTTLLGAWYLLLGRGCQPDDRLRFSGSCSLTGWETVASPLRWEPGPLPPAFPPHTSNTSARVPGLLHLAFKQHHDRRRDYVMTDAPGEWFRKWAVNQETPDAEGARWVAEHADAFVLVADREAMVGPEMGAARTGIQLLARRLADELQGRPVAFVWTKSDVQVPEEMEKAVRSAVFNVIPKAVEFSVSIMSLPDGSENAQGLLKLLRWALNIRRPTVRLAKHAGGNTDPVFTFGTR